MCAGTQMVERSLMIRKTERGAAGLPGWREAVVGVKQKAFSRSAAPCQQTDTDSCNWSRVAVRPAASAA